MKTIEIILTVIFTIIVVALVAALPTMLLWDWLMPKIFGLPEITFWQALGLILLSSILFKSHNSKN